MKITYYAATSSDGFIAREDGDVSWLDEIDVDPDGFGYEEFFACIDGLVMGRDTYDFVFDYGSWPYEDKLTWVCTSTELEILKGANLKVVSTVEDVIKEAKLFGYTHLWMVGGGQLASSFLEKGLLTHLSITQMPIELKTGIPLFANHNLESLAGRKTESSKKNGVKQIDLVLENNPLAV
ncbi:dihydrofolate reductase [bacterium]|jgi:dihydrofolate reductase|nr:dihydrofolate reductase [bacterium]